MMSLFKSCSGSKHAVEATLDLRREKIFVVCPNCGRRWDIQKLVNQLSSRTTSGSTDMFMSNECCWLG